MFRAAAESGHREAKLFLGEGKGDAEAQLSLGRRYADYADGRGVPYDTEEATRWMRLAAERGLADAQFALGRINEYRDQQEAVKWLRLAADQGNAEALMALGRLYEINREDSPANLEEAAKWYRLAAEQGLPAAQLGLAHMYEAGEGVPESLEEAAKWYRRAAEQGDRWAQYRIGELYAEGKGVPQDNVQAYLWLTLATEHGYGDEDRRAVRRKMTPTQVGEAQVLAKNWKPQKPAEGKPPAP